MKRTKHTLKRTDEPEATPPDTVKPTKPATPAEDPDRRTKSGRLDLSTIKKALEKADKEP